MATYGYAGDFSSDDDEKVEQAQQAPAKYDNNVRPTKTQIEEAIQFIKRAPIDGEVNLNDDVLAGLLDYYQTQRGPIVDSTRKLYNKIALRLVRDDHTKDTNNDAKETNGNSNNNNNNNNNIDANPMSGKGVTQQSTADTFSSDEEEIEMTANAKKFDSRVVYGNNNVVATENDEDRMEVDSEPPSGAVRNNKPIELPTTDEEPSSSSDEDPSEAGEDPNSESSDVLEVTPIRPPASANREKEAVEVLMAMRPSTPKQTGSSSIKRQPLAHSTPKESFVETAKKPYTRSQRITTRSATKSRRDMQQLDSKNSPSVSTDVFIEKKRAACPGYTLVTVTLLVLVLALLAYYYRSSILNTAEPLLRKKISF